MDSYFTAINYVRTVHGCAHLYRGGRIARIKADFRNTMQKDRNRQGILTYRALLPDHGMVHFFDLIREAEAAEDDVICLRAAMVLVKILTWTRAVSIGAILDGDVVYVGSFLAVTIRVTKCGREEFEPTQFTIPWPPEDNLVATFVMGFIRRTLGRLPEFSARAAGLTKANAPDRLTEWMRVFMPSEVLNLPSGASISSHSSRDTGASHSRCSL